MYVLSRIPDVNVLHVFFKMNSRQENRSELPFTAKILTKYSSGTFSLNRGRKIVKRLFKPDTVLGQIIVSCIN